MGMLIGGKWDSALDQSMIAGAYRREASALPTLLDKNILRQPQLEPQRFVLIASASCPWSHGAVITLILCNFADNLPVQWAGGPRIEGYGLLPNGPITSLGNMRYVHQLYSMNDPDYTGRATVPVLWDTKAQKILSNSSADIIAAFDMAGSGPNLLPKSAEDEIDALTIEIFDGLSNAVYRAGKAERQDEYDEAVDTVFATMDRHERRLLD